MSKRHILVLILTLGLVVAIGPAVAAQGTDEFLGGKVRTGDSITIPRTETVDGDLYIFGGTLAIQGTVLGDVIAFGGQIDIDGIVEGDVYAMGGTITISGTVAGDVRAAGGQINLSGSAGEDAALAGGQTTMSGTVGEDFLFTGGQATLSGDVGRDVLGSAGTYSMTGSIGGIEDVTLGDTGATVVEARNPFVEGLLRAISLLLFGALMIWAFFGRTTAAIERAESRWLESVGWGLGFLVVLALLPFVVLIAGILLAILAGISGLGAWVGLFVFAMVAALAVGAFVAFTALIFVAPVTIGTWIGKRVIPTANRFAWMALGVLILVAIGMIPVMGLIVGFLVIVMGTGAWIAGIRKVKSEEAPPVEPEMAMAG